MKYLNTSEEFRKLFGNIEADGYIDPIGLNDTKVGFSIQRKYPPNIGFIPTKTKNGEDDDIAVIWVVYEALAEDKHSKKIPIRLRIAKMSKYRAKNWDYDFSKEDSPTRESVNKSKESIQPLEFTCIDEYFYDANTQELVDSNNKSVTGSKILNELFDYHCKSTHPVKGLIFRARNKSELLKVQFYDFLIKSIKYVLDKCFGRTLDNHFNKFSYEGYLPSDFKKTADSVLQDVAGYRASKKVIILFVALVITFCLVYLPAREGSYFEAVLNNELLTVIHCFLALYVLDEWLPMIFFHLLNKTISSRKDYLNKLLRRGKA